MAIIIQTQQDYIPIHLGNEEIRFYISDDSILKIRQGYKQVQDELESIKKAESEEKQVEQMKEVLQKGFDFLFSEGTFDKVYGVSPSVIICLEYFGQMVDAVLAELDKKMKRTSQDKVKRYLSNKNKKK